MKTYTKSEIIDILEAMQRAEDANYANYMESNPFDNDRAKDHMTIGATITKAMYQF